MTKEEVILKFIQDFGNRYEMDSVLWRELILWLEKNFENGSKT